MAPDGSCSYKHTLFCGSRRLLMAPDDSHRVSLLLNHYPELCTVSDKVFKIYTISKVRSRHTQVNNRIK